MKAEDEKKPKLDIDSDQSPGTVAGRAPSFGREKIRSGMLGPDLDEAKHALHSSKEEVKVKDEDEELGHLSAMTTNRSASFGSSEATAIDGSEVYVKPEGKPSPAAIHVLPDEIRAATRPRTKVEVVVPTYALLQWQRQNPSGSHRTIPLWDIASGSGRQPRTAAVLEDQDIKVKVKSGDEDEAFRAASRSDVDMGMLDAGANREQSPIPIRQESPDMVLFDAPIAPPPQKRRRLEDGSAEISSPVRDPQRENDLEEIRKNVEIKKTSGMEIDLDTVRRRLDAIKCISFVVDLDREIAELQVPRAFLSATYGGSCQETFPTISPEHLAQHGMDDFMYVNGLFQPFGPGLPGRAGMFLGTRPGSDYEDIMRVITRVDSCRWQFMGMYRVLAANPPAITKEEWASQEKRVQMKWASAICAQGWGVGVCCRVLARKELGREGTKAEIDELASSQAYKKKEGRLGPQDVLDAYLCGEEQMGVWTMECVAYDEDFQRDIHSKFPLWTRPPPKEPGSRKAKASTRKKSDLAKKGRASKSGSGVKRKRSPVESESEEEPSDYDDDSDMDWDVEFIPRGTRSRPITIL